MAEIFLTQDGSHSIFSPQFGVTYHSKYGAIQETQHVFIDAALRYKMQTKKNLRVLDIGFGSGLNVLMTYLEAKKYKLKVHLATFEKFPIPSEEAQALNFVEALNVTDDAFIFHKMHACSFNQNIQLSNFFSFKKYHQDFASIDFQNEFDVIYFDAFSPISQPELWGIPMMQKMYNALKVDGVLTTYCAKGAVKRTLKSIGFEVESLKGPPGKREMTRAIKSNKEQTKF